VADITYRLVKGTELTFGELDRNFGSLDSDIVRLQSQVDSLAVSAGLDSARATDLITSTVDSAYVELMYSKIDVFRDSNFVIDIVDSNYVNLRVDLAALGAMDSARTIALIDSALDSVGPFYTTIDHDSDTLVQVDSAYVRHRADSGYIMDIIDSGYIKFRADSDYIKTAADSQYVSRIAEDVAGLDSAKLIRFLDSEARHIIPLDGETYDLGTNLKRWRNIYVKDLFVSPATIHFSDSAETPQSTISLDSGGEFKLQSPTQTGFIATSTTGTAFDSNTILSIIDSAYIQSRQVDIDTVRDSAFVTSIIDAAYVQARQVDEDTVRDSAFITAIIDSAYIQSREAAAGGSGIDSATSISLTQSTIDSAYIQARQVDLDTQRDSAFINNVIDDRIDSTQFLSNVVEDTTPQLGGTLDVNSNNIQFGDSGRAQFGAGPDLEMYHDGTNSFIDDVGDGSIFIRSGTTYFQNAAGTKTSFQTNSGGAQKFFYNNDLKIETVDSGAKVTGNLTVTGEVKSVGPGVQIAGGRFNYANGFSYDSAGATPGRYVKGQFGISNIVRNQAGRYTITFDSANQTLLEDSYSYMVMAIVDYKGDNPIAGARTVTVNTQSANSFDLVAERTDTGDDGDYNDISLINFMVFKS
jgi:hypothetical protein